MQKIEALLDFGQFFAHHPIYRILFASAPSPSTSLFLNAWLKYFRYAVVRYVHFLCNQLRLLALLLSINAEFTFQMPEYLFNTVPFWTFHLYVYCIYGTGRSIRLLLFSFFQL